MIGKQLWKLIDFELLKFPPPPYPHRPLGCDHDAFRNSVLRKLYAERKGTVPAGFTQIPVLRLTWLIGIESLWNYRNRSNWDEKVPWIKTIIELAVHVEIVNINITAVYMSINFLWLIGWCRTYARVFDVSCACLWWQASRWQEQVRAIDRKLVTVTWVLVQFKEGQETI